MRATMTDNPRLATVPDVSWTWARPGRSGPGQVGVSVLQGIEAILGNEAPGYGGCDGS
jgi:hypothetical protein